MSSPSSLALETEIFQYTDEHQSDYIELPDGQDLPLPPVILGELVEDPQSPTVCFYGHVDVQPAKKEDGWKTDPYTQTEINGNLHGCGAIDNKGPVLAWINAVETFKALKLATPVNFKFVIEGMEEAGSLGLEKLLQEENQCFFSDVDYVLISDSLWLSNKKCALTYGSRGNACFFVEVECGSKDLHSGTFGGIIHELLMDLIVLLVSLVDHTGHIQIPGIYDSVASLTEEERKLYESLEFNLEEHKNNSDVKKFFYGTKVVEHLESVFSKRNSPNKLKVSVPLGEKPWLADVNDPLYKAARWAIKTDTTTLKEPKCLQPFSWRYQSSIGTYMKIPIQRLTTDRTSQENQQSIS